jgi:hypothetical protein
MASIVIEHPDFVEDIIKNVETAIQGMASVEQGSDESFVVSRPNPQLPGSSINLARTTLYIGKPLMSPLDRAAHISNILYDGGKMISVVYEKIGKLPTHPVATAAIVSEPELPGVVPAPLSITATRHYLPADALAAKQVKATYRDAKELPYDIVEFLISAEIPAL